MKKILPVLMVVLALSACKKEKKQEEVAAAPPPPPATVQDLATQATSKNEDWVANIQNFLEAIDNCAAHSPVATKYVFRAENFEIPPIMLVLIKGEDDKVYACSLDKTPAPGTVSTPKFKEITLNPQPKAARFYPGTLPKADSCLSNTRILDKSGKTAGWLARITC